MSDDWNLKNDCLVIIDNQGNRGYNKPCIKTLRKKLIKDLDDRTLGISFKLTSKPGECFSAHINLIKAQMIDIINKRFGVKHNAKSKKR